MSPLKSRISGEAVRDKIVAKMRAPTRAATKRVRAAVIKSPGNRQLLAAIAVERPRSISELASLMGEVEGGFSQAMSALARAGLLTMIEDSRASIPTLTAEGQQMVEELRLTSIDHKQAPIDRVRTGVFSVILAHAGHRDLESDEIFGKLLIRFRDVPPESRVVAKGDTDLNALSIRLLENWWRILCRHEDPFELLPMRVATWLAKTPGAVRARSLGGRIQLTAFPENEPDSDRFLTEERSSDSVLDC